MEKRYVIRRLSETEARRCPCGDAYRVLTGEDGPDVSVHFVQIAADARAHYHRERTEVYVVLEGEGGIELDGSVEAVSPGTVVKIPPGVRHRARGAGGSPTCARPASPRVEVWCWGRGGGAGPARPPTSTPSRPPVRLPAEA